MIRSLFSGAGLALLLSGILHAGPAEIEGPHAALDGHKVLLTFQLQGAFDQRLEDRLTSGLPTTITYEFELLRDRKRWLDRGLQRSSLTVVGIYDAVRREYLVNYKLDGRLVESRMVRSLDELERAMTRFERFEVFTLEPLQRRSRLLVRARAELGLKRFWGFIPSKITTSWQESGKFRPPPDLYPS